MPYEDNIEPVLASYENELPLEDHELEIGNSAPYARELHEREGFSVLNASSLAEQVAIHLRAALLNTRPLSDDEITGALKAAANAEVARLQGFTGGMVPGVERDSRGKIVDKSPRPEHPEGWGDRTTQLASSFYRKVDGAGVRVYPYDGRRYVIPHEELGGD